MLLEVSAVRCATAVQLYILNINSARSVPVSQSATGQSSLSSDYPSSVSTVYPLPSTPPTQESVWLLIDDHPR